MTVGKPSRVGILEDLRPLSVSPQLRLPKPAKPRKLPPTFDAAVSSTLTKGSPITPSSPSAGITPKGPGALRALENRSSFTVSSSSLHEGTGLLPNAQQNMQQRWGIPLAGGHRTSASTERGFIAEGDQEASPRRRLVPAEGREEQSGDEELISWSQSLEWPVELDTSPRSSRPESWALDAWASGSPDEPESRGGAAMAIGSSAAAAQQLGPSAPPVRRA